MRKLTKRLILFIIAFSLIACPIIESLPKVEASTSYQYAWLYSTPRLYIEHVSGNTYKLTPAGTASKDENASKTVEIGKEITIPVHTLYSRKLIYDDRALKLDGWNGVTFTYDGASYPPNKAPSRYKPGYVFDTGGKVYDGCPAYYAGYTVSSIRPDDSYFFYPTSVGPLDCNTGWYTVRFTLTQSMVNGSKSTGYLAPMAVFLYKSSKPLSDGGGSDDDDDPDPIPPDPEPEPEPEPVPSEAGVSLSVSASNISCNYMNFSGTAEAIATARDVSYYADEGSLSSLTATVAAFEEQTDKVSDTRRGTSTATLKKTFNGKEDWMNVIYPGVYYSYSVQGRGVTRLTNGASPRTDTATGSATGHIQLTNNAPSVNMHLNTTLVSGDNINNDTTDTIQSGYYYTNTDVKIQVNYIDPENDTRDVYLAMGLKSIMDSNYASFIYHREHDDGDTPEMNYVGDQYEVVDVTENINGYTATIRFKEPGVYSYRAFINDAYSNDSLVKSAEITGTFTVRGDPEPPVAVISSPAYAFENEAFKVRQSSTDPNGVDDIITYTWTPTSDVTAEVDPDLASEEGFTEVTNVTNSWPGNGTVNGKNGGTLTFPTGSAHHVFQIALKVVDATNLSDTAYQNIKVISNVPVANLEVIPEESGGDASSLKENRKITISAANSLAPSTDPIDWKNAQWEIKAISGGSTDNIHEDDTQRKDNKQRVFQFDKPGVYEVTLTLSNNFSKANPDHEDIGASTAKITITVIEDKNPISSVVVTSGTPEFNEAGQAEQHTVSFKVTSNSIDGDIINAPSAYEWVIYEDKNDDGQYTDDEIITDRTYNSDKTEVSVKTTFEEGRHNKIKAVVTTTETFAEQYIEKFLKSDGSWKRYATVETVETVNWKPTVDIVPPTDPSTPYEETDIDGDTLLDGKFIKAYEDDTIRITNKIIDEFQSTVKITWELSKKDHSGNFNTTQGNTSWIKNSAVSHTLGHDGGTIKIASPGIYMLKMYAKDDMGLTAESTIMLRIYTLPIAVLETNPNYQIDQNNEWKTKENIRFDLRSNPTIVDDEWGVAWHQMDWSKDNWDVRPLEGQSATEIHFMKDTWGGTGSNVDADAYPDQAPDDDTVFSGRNSPLGFGYTKSTQVDIILMTGLVGDPLEDNKYELDSTERQKLEAAAEQLKEKLLAYDSRYNIKVYTARAAEESDDIIRTPIIYGYFDGFSNTQEENMNMYTKEYTTTYENEGIGSIGTTTVTGDVAKMNKDENGREGKFGVITLMPGYDPTYESTAKGQIFVGTAQLYCNDVLISEFDESTDWSSGEQAATMTREGDSWIVSGNTGNSVSCNEETDINFKVQFTGATGCGDHLALVARGWCGIYNDETATVTHPNQILDTLNSLGLRTGSTKFLVYVTGDYDLDRPTAPEIEGISSNQMGTTVDITNNTFVMPEVASKNSEGIGLSEESKTLDTNLKNYLIQNNIHLFLSEPKNLLSTYLREPILTSDEIRTGKDTVYTKGDTSFITDTVYDYIIANTTLEDNSWYRSCTFTEPGLYSITYWGTNYGGKVTKPVTYYIEVIEDEPPIIYGEVASKFLRDTSDTDPAGKYRASIAITGPYSESIRKDALTVTSPDGDYIDYTLMRVKYDSNNDKIFSQTDVSWAADGSGLPETTGKQLQQTKDGMTYYLWYVLNRFS